jgi:hypothetical protein
VLKGLHVLLCYLCLQVVPTLLSFSVSAKQLLQGLLSTPATAARMKQLLVQQTGVWDESATSEQPALLGRHTEHLNETPSSSRGASVLLYLGEQHWAAVQLFVGTMAAEEL